MYKKIESSEVIKREKRIGTLTSAFKPEYRLLSGKNFSEPTWKGKLNLEDFAIKMTNIKTCPDCPVYCIHEYENVDGIK